MSKTYPTCSYILTRGTLCQSPALKDNDLCYYHHRDRQRKENLQQARELKCSDQFYKYPMQQELLNPEIIESLEIPSLDDGPSIQVAITNIVRAVLSGHVSDKKAGLALFGCQIAASNLNKVHLSVYASDAIPQHDTNPIQPYLETKPHPAGYADDLKAARKLIDAAQKLGRIENQGQKETADQKPPAASTPPGPPASNVQRETVQRETAPTTGNGKPETGNGLPHVRQNGELTPKGEGGTTPSRETRNEKLETAIATRLTTKPNPKTFAQHIKLAAALHKGHIDAEQFAREQKLEQKNAQRNGTSSS